MTEPAPRSLRAWLLLRTGLSTVLLGVAFTMLPPGAELEPTGIAIEAIALFTIASSFAVARYASIGGSSRRAGAILMALDIATVTAAVSVTGGAGSVLAALYGAVILATATTVGGRVAFLAGGLSLTCYSAVGFGMALGYLPHPSDQNPRHYLLDTEDLVFSMLSNGVAITIVSLLSDWLAVELERRTGALAASEESRQRLHALHEDIVRSIGSGLLTVDREGRITSINPTARTLLRLSSDSATRRLDDFFPVIATSTRDENGRFETRTVREDGTEFVAGYSIAQLRGSDGAPSGTLLVFQDLTEIHRLEAAERDAERLSTLGRVAATLAHEIRNPLSSISGSVELVREHAPLDDEDRNLLSLVVREVERLDDLVRDMLDVARPRSPRFETFELRTLCRDVATVASGGTSVTVATNDGAPLEVVADADMVRQVVWNLCKNAIQSSPADGTVRIESHRSEDGGFTIEVLDDGPGIPEADMARIFDAFHTGRTRGVGLGLALVRRVVEAHRGSIRVDNRAPHGARFLVSVPLLPRTSAPVEGTRPSSDGSTDGSKPTSADAPRSQA